MLMLTDGAKAPRRFKPEAVAKREDLPTDDFELATFHDHELLHRGNKHHQVEAHQAKRFV
jgi:hypothetical protein